MQQFAGALQGQRAGKGIFITTSSFTDEARNFVKGIGSKIVLVDGEELAVLMIDYGIGVATSAVYEIKRIDSDYFVEAWSASPSQGTGAGVSLCKRSLLPKLSATLGPSP